MSSTLLLLTVDLRQVDQHEALQRGRLRPVSGQRAANPRHVDQLQSTQLAPLSPVVGQRAADPEPDNASCCIPVASGQDAGSVPP